MFSTEKVPDPTVSHYTLALPYNTGIWIKFDKTSMFEVVSKYKHLNFTLSWQKLPFIFYFFS